MLAGVLLALLAVRAALPEIVKRFVNRTLDGLNGYSGEVADIDLSLWRGAYQIKGLRIFKTNGKVPVPFVSADLIDLLQNAFLQSLHRGLEGSVRIGGKMKQGDED